MRANRELKNSLFIELFSDPERICELYNAIADTEYDKDTLIELNTLTDVFMRGVKNDLSFVIDGKFVVLIEHQSTLNENMPLRILQYIARVYERLTDNRAAYHEKLIKIQTPEFIVLYNGTEPYPSERIPMRASPATQRGAGMNPLPLTRTTSAHRALARR